MIPNVKKPIINDKRLFSLEQLTQKTRLDSFSCTIEEYNEYLFQEALQSQNDQMTFTWLLLERPPEPITNNTLPAAASPLTPTLNTTKPS
jgi:hypothetical protein